MKNRVPELAQVANSSKALRCLFELEKAANSVVSLQWICNQSGISSKGYLSQVMNGKRVLDLKYKESICHPFKLDYLSARVLVLLLERDHSQDDQEIQNLTKEMASIKKTADFYKHSLDLEVSHTPFALEVFCAVGLVGDKATAEELIALFPKSKKRDVRHSVELLVRIGFFTEHPDGGLSVVPARVVIDEENSPGSRARYLRNSIHESAAAVSEWLPREDLSYFESGLVSARSEDYKEFLTKMKGLMLEFQNSLESSDADCLVRYNLQVYPSILK